MSGNVSLAECRMGSMTIRASRCLDDAYPCVLEINGDPWQMTVEEARRFTYVALQIRPHPRGKHLKEGPRYLANVGRGDGKVVKIELGVRSLDDDDVAYFLFGESSIEFPVGEGDEFMRVIAAVYEDAAFLRQARTGGRALQFQTAPRWQDWRPQHFTPDPGWPYD